MPIWIRLFYFFATPLPYRTCEISALHFSHDETSVSAVREQYESSRVEQHTIEDDATGQDRIG
jgi:hypothetical protein